MSEAELIRLASQVYELAKAAASHTVLCQRLAFLAGLVESCIKMMQTSQQCDDSDTQETLHDVKVRAAAAFAPCLFFCMLHNYFQATII